MLTISKNANPNYLAKVIVVKGLRKHENADRLQVLTVDFQNVITGMNTKEGDMCIFFPLECKINLEFLALTNSFRDSTLNKDKEVVGFFEKKGRVKAMKLRGEKSMGYLISIDQIIDFTDEDSFCEGQEFDTSNGVLMLEKYVIPVKEPRNLKQGKKPQISRLVDGQFRFHVDTENLRRNVNKIKPDDNVSITYKVHGTSCIVSNVMVKRRLKIREKFLRLLGTKIDDKEYDHVYSSRKVCKNEYETKDKKGYYDVDIWGEAKEELREFIPKGYTFFCEIVGYTPGGGAIQGGYDYGCQAGQHKIFVYRVTFTNVDGIVRDMSTEQIMEWAEKTDFTYVPHFYTGKARDLFPEIKDEEHWHENFIKALEEKYNEKDCYMCVNKVPEEGIVLRKESLFEFESYKLKSFAYLQHETDMIDKGTEDMENSN